MKYSIGNSRGRHRKLPWRETTAMLVFIGIIFLFSARAVYRVYMNKRNSEVAAVNKANELKQLQERQVFLKNELEKLGTQAGVEAEIRQKFGVAKPGENVAIIVEAEGPSESATSTGLLSQIKNFFAGLFR